MLKDKFSIIRCIESCNNPQQLSKCYDMIEWFYEKWKRDTDMFALSLAMNDLLKIYHEHESKIFVI